MYERFALNLDIKVLRNDLYNLPKLIMPEALKFYRFQYAAGRGMLSNELGEIRGNATKYELHPVFERSDILDELGEFLTLGFRRNPLHFINHYDELAFSFFERKSDNV